MVRFVMLLCLVLTGCASRVANLPNFQWIYPHMSCSGRPTAEGWRMLSECGITNVVCLATRREIPDESWLATMGNVSGTQATNKRPQFTFHRYPLNTWQQIFGPCRKKLEAAAAAIGTNAAVMCLHGKNRSRSAVIFWRVNVCGWAYEDAVAEAKRYGWGSSFPALKIAVHSLKPKAVGMRSANGLNYGM